MHKNLLIKLLGLPDDASDEAISNAANTFQADMVAFKNDLEAQNETLLNSANEAKDQLTACAAARVTLENTNKAMTEELVNRDLETYKNVIVNAEEVKTQLLANRAGTVALLKNIKVVNKRERSDPLYNSRTAGTPPPVEPDPEAIHVAEAAAKRISNRAREMMHSLKIPHQQAFMAAKAEMVDTAK